MMGPAWCAVLAVLLAAAGPAAGRFVVEKNSVSVTSPEALKGKYECAIGNFGVPQYGGTLQGWVVYPKSNKDACKEFETSFKSHKSGERPNFVLIDRGGDRPSPRLCFFALSGSCFAAFYYSMLSMVITATTSTTTRVGVVFFF
jgi:hypothetical protein